MAPVTDFEILPRRRSKGKVVRFADNEGHSLCEVFRINCSQECNGPAEADEKSHRRLRKPKPLTLVTLPSAEGNLRDRIQQDTVTLENVVKTQRGIIGMVAVKNMAYDKDIFVRYTFDSWQTTLETQGAFYRQDQDNQADFFVFVLTNKAACYESNWNLEFAVSYRVAGQEFWDNNKGKNYEVSSD